MMAATNTTVQNRVPDELRSRVMAVYAMMFMGVQPIGSLVAGGVAKHIGAPRTLEVFGVIVLAASVVFAVRMMMRMKTVVAPVAGGVDGWSVGFTLRSCGRDPSLALRMTACATEDF